MADPNGRFRKVDTAILPPGVDFITHSTVGPFVDTQFAFDRNNPAYRNSNRTRVYLSVSTIRELAEVAGVVDYNPSDEQTVREARAYQRGYEEGVKENLTNDILDAVDRLGFIADLLRDFVGSPAQEQSSGEPAAVGDVQPDSGDAERVEAGGDEDGVRAPGQADGTPLDEGTAGIPGGSGGDDARFRI